MHIHVCTAICIAIWRMQKGNSTPMNSTAKKTEKYMKENSKDGRRGKGQFFTGRQVSEFMASLFDLSHIPKEISILDPGAGTGMLSAALLERLEADGRAERARLTCYETDENVLGLLEENLAGMKERSSLEIEYRIVKGNYIASQKKEYGGAPDAGEPERYDLIIGNPPYRKIGRNAEEALAMPDICYGAPNLYFLFMEMAAFNLDAHGEMVFIVPRSWTSGPYFRRFREKFLSEVHLRHIHLFESREGIFDGESVRQETVIIRASKAEREKRPKSVIVTASVSASDIGSRTVFEAPYDSVVSTAVIRGQKCVLPVTGREKMEALRKIGRWKDTLLSNGLRMKTGLVTEFRNRDVLREAAGKDAVPLLHSCHVRNGRVAFPGGRKTEWIADERKGLLQKNTNLLLVKRFSPKEYSRRLRCGVYLAEMFPEHDMISTSLTLNFIAGEKELSESTVYGLYVLMNSTLYDTCYRMLNGSTAVNSTELNSMPVPPLKCIEEMGRRLMASGDMSEKNCNAILDECA